MVIALFLAGCGDAVSTESADSIQDYEKELGDDAVVESAMSDNETEETKGAISAFTESPVGDTITPETEETSQDEIMPETEEVSQAESSSTETTSELCVGDAKIIFDEVNRVREEAGLSPLTWSDELARAADIRAGEIITVFSHTRPDGTNCRTVSPLAEAENIIRGPHTDGYEMMEKWMDSEGHRANILWPTLKTIGVATRCTDMGDTGVQLFGY